MMRCVNGVLDFTQKESHVDTFAAWVSYLGAKGRPWPSEGRSPQKVPRSEDRADGRPLLRPKIQATGAGAASGAAPVLVPRRANFADAQAIDARVEGIAESMAQLPGGAAKLQ